MTVGVMISASLDAAGKWLSFEIAPNERTLPSIPTTLAKRSCRGPISAYGVYGESDHVSEWRIVRLSEPDKIYRVDGLVMPFGDGLIIRERDGALTLRTPEGKIVAELAPAACAGRLRYADPAGEKAVVSCKTAIEHENRYMICDATKGCRDLGPRPHSMGPVFLQGMDDTNDRIFGELIDMNTEKWVATATLRQSKQAYLRDGAAWRLNGTMIVGSEQSEAPFLKSGMGPVRWSDSKQK